MLYSCVTLAVKNEELVCLEDAMTNMSLPSGVNYRCENVVENRQDFRPADFLLRKNPISTRVFA